MVGATERSLNQAAGSRASGKFGNLCWRASLLILQALKTTDKGILLGWLAGALRDTALHDSSPAWELTLGRSCWASQP